MTETKKKNSFLQFLGERWKGLALVRLGVFLLILLVVSCILGTLIPQKESPQKYVSAYGLSGYRIMALLKLTDLFHSFWFKGLIFLLVLSLLSCLWTRRRLRFRLLGFYLIHSGIIVILLGALVGLIWGDKGEMTIREGGRSDAYLSARDDKYKKIGYQILLDEFNIDYYEPEPAKLYVESKKMGKQAFTIAKGKEFILPDEGLRFRLRVEEYFPDAKVERYIENRSGEPHSPAVALRIGGYYQYDLALFANPGESQRTEDFTEDNKFLISYKWCQGPEEFEQALKEIPGERLTVFIKGTPLYKEVPVELGKMAHLVFSPEASGRREGRSFSFRVEKRFSNFATEDESFSPGKIINPALKIRLFSGDKSETRWAFALFPGFHHQPLEERLFPNVEFIYHYPQVFENHLRIVDGQGLGRILVYIREGKVIQTLHLEKGRPLVFEDGLLNLELINFYPDAQVREKVVEGSEKVKNEVVKLNLSSPTHRESFYLFATEPEWKMLGKGLFIAYIQEEPQPRRFSSLVRVFSGKIKLKRASILVNSPLKLGKFRLYQSGYNKGPGEETFQSILKVVSDPGIPVVYTGFFMLLGGFVFSFLVKPYLRGKGSF